MVDEHEVPRRGLARKGRYALIGMLVMLAAVAGMIVGRSSGRASSRSSQLPTGNEIILPSGGLLFKSAEGKLVAKLDADEVGASLMHYNAKEQATILIGATQFGGGLIGVTSGKGGSVLSLAGHEEGGSVVLLSQNRGKRVIRLTADDDGGSISVNGPTGDEGVTIDTIESGSAIKGRIEVLESRSGKLLCTSPTGTRTKP